MVISTFWREGQNFSLSLTLYFDQLTRKHMQLYDFHPLINTTKDKFHVLPSFFIHLSLNFSFVLPSILIL